MMNITNFPNYFGIRQGQQASPMDSLISMLNEKADGTSSLETAKQALMEAKSRLDQHRDGRMEQALDGYLSMRSRQNSYTGELEAQQKQLEDFQSLTSRYDALSEELAAAKADYDASASPDIQQTLRVSSLENELASVDRDISAMVAWANRCADGKRQYAAYLEQTGQGGYAAFEYQDQPESTRETFASEAAGLIGRLETGAAQWRERVSSYCEQFGLTPYDLEGYLQERHKLADAYYAAQQRLSTLLYAADGPAQDDDVSAGFDRKA